ncbi:MAG: pentapeptide repeat-containing protein, partial [Gammaproteobacteria bacterium]
MEDMKEKSDEPTNQPSEMSQPEAQEQPKYREVSPDELSQILEAHQKWVESDGKEGKQADLWKANLQKANLRNAILKGAYL